MKVSFEVARSARAAEEVRNAENPRIPIGAESFLQVFGISSSGLAPVTTDNALQVPAVAAAVAFLSRTLAALPLHAYRRTKDGPKKIDGKMEIVIHENPNPYMDSFKFRQYFWQQVFTGGRGMAWIERNGPQNIEAIWPMEPGKVTIRRTDGRILYGFEGREYDAADVIDIPFMLKTDMLNHYGPVQLAGKAIQLAIAMNDYASGFFAGGGVPPLGLFGPMPAGPDAMGRATADIKRAIDNAKQSKTPIFPMPGGYELKPIGFDPEKGQMTDARRFQIEEIARGWQLPPVFLHDLTHGLKSSTEDQDIHLVKHVISQWAEALEGEMNLKLFGRMNSGRYVEHNIDGLQRGNFATRMEGHSKSIQNAIRTPNEVRALENLPPLPDGDKLLIQGATVPIGSQPVAGKTPPKPDETPPNDDEGGPDEP